MASDQAGNVGTMRVCIGSGEASRVERKSLIHSIRKHTQSAVDVVVYNGTHNAIEWNDRKPYLSPLPLELKYLNRTEFSMYRYIIPEVCGYQGRAVYLDSDMICLADIRELFEVPMNGHAILAKRHEEPGRWHTSVLVIDCERCHWDMNVITEELSRGDYSHYDLMELDPKFLKQYGLSIGELDPRWNSFDYWDSETKLIHYTGIETQPWKLGDHPYGELWFQYFNEAKRAGVVTDDDIDLSILRGYVRRDIRRGNYTPLGRQKNAVRGIVKSARRLLRPARA